MVKYKLKTRTNLHMSKSDKKMNYKHLVLPFVTIANLPKATLSSKFQKSSDFKFKSGSHWFL